MNAGEPDMEALMVQLGFVWEPWYIQDGGEWVHPSGVRFAYTPYNAADLIAQLIQLGGGHTSMR